MASERPVGFVKAINFTLPWETGKDKNGNLRADGGLNYVDGNLPTKYGIWKGANPEVDVENLTVEGAIDIYKRKYWDVYVTLRPTNANLENLPVSLAVAVFDSGVNCGPNRAINWLGNGLKDRNPTKSVIDQRVSFYTDKASKNPSYPLKGMLNRTNDLRKYCDIIEQDAQQSFGNLAKILGRPIG